MIHYRHWAQEKRYMLFRLFQEHLSQRRIAHLLEVSHSTVSREMQRNRTVQDLYRYDYAQGMASRRREHCRKRPVLTAELQIKVIEKLNQDWSPEQISGRFRLDKISTISHQSIYNWLWRDRQFGGELYRKLRRKRKYFKHKTKSNHILDRRMIEERPAIVETRSRFGDWELDDAAPRKTAEVSKKRKSKKYGNFDRRTGRREFVCFKTDAPTKRRRLPANPRQRSNTACDIKLSPVVCYSVLTLIIYMLTYTLS